MEAIAHIQLRQLEERVCSKGLRLQLPEELPAYLASCCRSRDGARQIRHLIQEKVEGPLAHYLLHLTQKPGRLYSNLEEGRLHFFG